MATKAVINGLFTAIRNGDEAGVRRMIEADPALVHAKRTAPPKKDDGQSPLQVACKTGRFAIAHYLVDRGADVNYIEDSQINEWRAPVLHDAIRAAAFSMRVSPGGSAPSFAAAMTLLRRLLEKGADPKAVDSYGNNALLRALMDLRQQLAPLGIPQSADAPRNRLFDEDAGVLLKTLIDAGADVRQPTASRESALDMVRGEYLEKLLS